MSYQVTYDPTGGYVEVVTTGTLTLQVCEEFMREMVLVARTHNCHHFLVDHSKSWVSVDLLDAIKLAESPDSFGFTKTDKVAVYASIPFSPQFIFQDKAVSNGWSFIYFSDLDQAKPWLRSVS